MNLKQQAAEHALSYVHSGMILGLGTGSTTDFFIDMLGERLNSGSITDIKIVPTSESTRARALALNMAISNLTDHPKLDLAVDGADEVDPQLNLIKGLGRALLREKIVEIHTDQFIVIVDETKLVKKLGSLGPLPVEIVPFEHNAHVRWLNTLGCRAELWLEENGQPVMTDNGNFLVRCWFSHGIPDPHALARQLADRPGIVEHGLFLGMASRIIAAGNQGIQILERKA
ncbi:MAG: ribose-5-phosphate isomerase RpiA [Anaerolineales bacterium]|nr:ribose-5-phosphate isomerase RpiA [Anaerolineales bacterium]